MIIKDRAKGLFLSKETLFFIVILLGSFPLWARAETTTPEQRADAWFGEVRLPAKNYVRNGSFESGTEGWEYFEHKAGGLDGKVVFSGNASFWMGGFDENKGIYFRQRNILLETGKIYTVSAAAKAEDITFVNGAFALLHLINAGWSADEMLTSPTATIKNWTSVTKTFVAPKTKPRPDGKPEYTLVIYFPPKSKGQIWLDNIQIEEGDKATEYSDVFAGDGLVALEKLKGLIPQIFATQDALSNFKGSALANGLSEELRGIMAQAEGVREDLKKLEKLTKSDREGLTKRIEGCLEKLAEIRTVVWTGPAHIPLREVELPAAKPDKLGIELTCLKGEHRDIALNIANLTTDGYQSRLIISELNNEPFALRIPPLQWVMLYTVPLMRGYVQPAKVFTDALPEVDKSGIIQVAPAATSQAIISIDTSHLLPGDYTGSIIIASLPDAANRQEIPVKLKVLSAAILPIKGVDIGEDGHADYAWEAMIELGVNTFNINTQWMDEDFDEDGSLSRLDFTRLDPEINHALAFVPDARFFLRTMDNMFGVLERRYGWKPEDPRFEKAIKEWLKAIVAHFRTFKVEPARLIIETYDEPGEGDYPRGIKMARWIEETDPAIQSQYCVTGIGKDAGWKEFALAHTITAPIVQECTPDNMAYIKTLGKKLWVYDCQNDGETFHPIAYYRLLPWMCRKDGIQGWLQFSWFNSGHHGYQAWEGVEGQCLVYPTLDGKDMVISRRFLGMRAGNEDYQVLDALERAISRFGTTKPQQTEQIAKFLLEAYDRALNFSPRERGYQTHIKTGLPADLLDTLRQEAVKYIEKLLPVSKELEVLLENKDKKALLSAQLPEPGRLRVQYLVDGKLPWYIQEQKVVPAGKSNILLESAGEVNRCLVEFADKDGWILVGSPLIIPRISVDSTFPAAYTQLVLNDGIRLEAVKFEQEYAWISSGANVEHWVEMDLGKPRQVSEVNLYWMTYTGLSQKNIIQYLDGAGPTNWKPVSATPDWRPATGPVERIKFMPVTTGKVRILMAPGGGGWGGPRLMGLSEVEVK